MSGVVKRLAGSDTSTVPTLMALAREASPAQIIAVGAGLAMAAGVCIAQRDKIQKLSAVDFLRR